MILTCVLLSNALENAIHACREVQKEGKEARIEVQIYEKQQQVFLQIKNSCAGAPIFENGVPVSKKKGHGIGTRSICAIVERYGGVYTFSLEKESVGKECRFSTFYCRLRRESPAG